MSCELTEEPPIRWTVGSPWPRGWAQCPTFEPAYPGGLRFVEILNDTWLTDRLRYPKGPYIPLPDRLGRTDGEEWVLWEEKTCDNVVQALRQLDAGLRNLRTLAHPVHRLGLSIEKFGRKEGWKRGVDGYLVRKGQLGQAPHDISSLRIMVEMRGR